MSGIAGIIHFDGQPVTPGQIETMTAAMPYRGPDGIKHWRRGHVAVGQCMLRTTPESLEETQPLTNEDESLILVMDGRVDNWQELRRKLLAKSAVLRTRADAELVLRAYETWGAACLPHVEGDFALFIWDARHQLAFCARDRVGNKPFIYHFDGKTLSFASEVHPLLALPWVPEQMNPTMIAEYLGAAWNSLSETLWTGLLRLTPSHTMVVKHGQAPRLTRYWSPDLHLIPPCKSDQEYIEYYRSEFTDVVRRMSRSHHPLAIEVSGGLDSSAIFAVADSLMRQGKLPATQMDGYTLDFRGDENADELDYARTVATFVGRPVHEVIPAHMPLEWYSDTARVYRDLPDYPHGSVGLSIAEAARTRGSRVLMGGTGGDEWTGGCRLYYGEAIARRQWAELLRIVQRDVQAEGKLAVLSMLIRQGVFPLLPAGVRHALRKIVAMARNKPNRPHAAWLSPVMRRHLTARSRDTRNAVSNDWPRLGQQRQWTCLVDGYGALARELNERRYSRMGLEWRQPFWDRAIVQTAFSTPEHVRLRSENKWLHRRALSGLLPESVLRRSTKAEFSVVFARHWGDLSRLTERHVFVKRHSWLDVKEFTGLMKSAFDVDRQEWGTGIVWTLFGLDAIASSNSSAPTY
ncbi:MAG: hypothetical protein H7203_10020 [Rhizobacter sp.]|nr:hypothetical protein [Burkholderiales bacterium]